MPSTEPPGRIQFEGFELDLRTRELCKGGRPIKLQDQPGRLLALLASRAGQLVTRAEIEKALWGEDQFVEFEHAVNTAVRKVREALGDDPESPRFIETLPRKGYRFIAQVNPVRAVNETSAVRSETAPPGAQPDFRLPQPLARALFLTIQFGYLSMYSAALYELDAVDSVLARTVPESAAVLSPLLMVTAMCGIAVRLYLISAVGFRHPAAGEKFRRLFPFLFALDVWWAASPLLLAPRIGLGLVLGAVAALAYLPFSQRTLIRRLYS
jgi:DNA-binding winged helix-turn-helix (wHTH) protein